MLHPCSTDSSPCSLPLSPPFCSDIDFGHFLGNFKTKFGFKRERSAFVFTPEMAFVMGGKNYKKSPLFKLFKECCFKAFNVLRKHAATLENLFLLVRNLSATNGQQLLSNRCVVFAC